MVLILILAGLVLTLLLGWLWLRRARSAASEPLEATPTLTPQAQLYRLQQSGKFWGVSLESHCRASSQFAGRQFPFGSVPTLPVESCTETICRCCLNGLPDRRRCTDRRLGEDRRSDLRMDANDRRSDRPRRKDDLNSWTAYSHL